MKKIFMMAVMAVAALSANAQNEKGQFTLMPKAGINISTITGGDFKNDKKAKAGFVGGVEAEYGISDNFGLAFGLLYSMEGVKYSEKYNGVKCSVNGNLDYLNIPILAQFYPVKGLAIKAGLQPAFNVRHKEKFEASEGKESISYTGNLEGVKSFNLSIPVGVSYEYAKFVLDARYNIGLTKIFKDADQGRNSTFAITLGYKFAL